MSRSTKFSIDLRDVACHLNLNTMKFFVTLLLVLFVAILEATNACERCCAGKLEMVSNLSDLWTQEDLARLKSYYLTNSELPLRIRKHLENLTLERLNSNHARLIHSQLMAQSDFDGGFNFNNPFVCSGTAQIMDSGTKLNISIDNIRLLKPSPTGNGGMVPLEYGEVPSNPREAFDLIGDLITAIARLGFEAASHFPNLRVMVLSALSVRVERAEDGLKENRLLRLIQGKFGFGELIDPISPQSIVLQLRIPLTSPSGLQPGAYPKPRIFNADAPRIDGVELLRIINQAP